MRSRLGHALGRLVAAARRRQLQGQRGFTLIEVIATVTIIGIIALPLGAAMVFGLRTAFTTQENLARTADVNQLSAYFPSDVQSVDAAGVNPTDSNNVNICSANPLADETSLITFVWDEDLGISGQSMARYIAKGSGKNSEIVRRFCRGAADPTKPAATDNDWTDITLAQNFGTTDGKDAWKYTITTDAAAPYPGDKTPQCTDKSCFLEIHGSYDYRLTANRRVPGEDPNARPPDAPAAVHGVPGNGRVTLYWTDGNDNGSGLTSYTILTQPGTTVLHPITAGIPTGTTGVQINGLTNASSYKFKVKATNASGSSGYSDWSDTIVPGPTTPDPPTIGAATASPTVNGSASVTWSLPSDYNNGGAALVGFRVYAINSPSAPFTVDVNSASATTGTITGLADNTQYLLQVSARNVYGEGSPSAAANPIVTLPSAPGTPNAQYGGSSGTVTLTFNPPTTGDFTYLTNFRAKVSTRSSAETAVPVATACPSGAAGTCTLQVTGLSTGQTYSIAVQAQNSAGWGPLSDPATAELTPPTISGSTIAPVGGTNGGFIGSGNPYYVYANATDASGISTVTANVDNVTSGTTTAVMTSAGGPWTIGSATYTYRSTSLTAGSSLSAGSKSYSISATDSFANSATTAFSVTVDNTPPSVTLTQVNGSTHTFPWNTSAASLTSVAGACTTGAGNNTTVAITVTGPTPSTGTANCSSSSWSYTFPTAISTEGNYTFEATQSDYAGNAGTSGTKAVNLDRTGPTISRSVIASTSDTTVGGFIKSGGSYYIYANVTDDISGVAGVNANTSNITTGSTSVALTAGDYQVGAQSYNYRSASRTASSISAGSKSYTVTATDAAGGSSGAQSFTVTVTSTVPVITASVIGADGSPTAGYIGQGKPYYVYANVTDASGVQTVTANVARDTNNTITSSQTAASMTAGSYTVGATTYGWRSAQLTANSSLSTSTNPKTFSITATDSATLSATTNFTVSIDNTAPTVAITKVNNVTVGSWPYSTNVNVTSVGGTCSTGSTDSTTVSVTLAGADDESGTATCSAGAWTYIVSPAWSAEGSSTIDASQSDFAGNTGNATQRTVNVDKTVPVVTLTTPADGLLTNDATPPLAGGCTTGQGTVSVTIAGPTNATVNNLTCSGGGTWSGTSSSLSSGAYTATATQTDAAGNTGISNTNSFTLDTTAPTVASVIAPSGVTTGGYLAQGVQYYAYANVTDSSGVASANANLAVSSNVLTSGATSVALSTSGGPWTIGGTAYTYRTPIQTANASISSGTKNYTITAVDNAGNSTTPTFMVMVDNTAPSVAITKVNNVTVGSWPYSTNVNVTSVAGTCGTAAGDIATVNVDLAGTKVASGSVACTSGTWTYTLPSAWSAEGSSTVDASQDDLAGNTGNATQRTVTIDKTVPVVTLTTPANGLVTNDTTPPLGGACTTGQGNVAVAITGPTTTSVTGISCSSGTWSSTAPTLTAGGYSVTATQTDAAGNTGTSNTNTFTLDRTAPTVTSVIAPVGVTTGGYLSQGQQYYVYANATDTAGVSSVTGNVAVTSNVLTTGVTSTSLTTSGGPWTIGGTAYAYRSTALTSNSSITAGSKTYSVTATDNPGNSGSTNFTVIIDNTAPAPTVTSVNGTTHSFPYTTNANVTSVGGACGTATGDVATVSVTIAGVENETGNVACTSGAWTYTLTSAWSAEGSSTVVASQDDLAGNTGTSASRTVSVDKTSPVVSAAVMASTADTTVGGYVRQGGSYYVYANVTDAGSSVNTVTANVTNITSGTTATSLSTTSGPWTVAGTSYNYRSSGVTASNPLSQGTKTYTIAATDTSGNSGTTPNQSVTVDNTLPAPSAFSLTNGATVGQIDVGDSFTVTYNGPINPNTICAGLTDSNNVTGVSITLTGNGSSNDTLAAPASPCANFFSAVNLGGDYYNTSSTRTLTTTFNWNATTNAVTVSITALSSTSSRDTVSSPGTPTYLPKTSILDPAGNAMAATTFNGTSSRF